MHSVVHVWEHVIYVDYCCLSIKLLQFTATFMVSDEGVNLNKNVTRLTILWT